MVGVWSHLSQKELTRETHPKRTAITKHISVNVFVYTMFVDSPVNLIKSFNPDLPIGIRPANAGEKSRAEYIPITLDSIEKISSVRLRVPDEFKSSSAKKNLLKTMKDLPKRLPDGIPLMDPIESMKIDDNDFKLLLEDRCLGIEDVK